jgi:hypothetical protein
VILDEFAVRASAMSYVAERADLSGGVITRKGARSV